MGGGLKEEAKMFHFPSNIHEVPPKWNPASLLHSQTPHRGNTLKYHCTVSIYAHSRPTYYNTHIVQKQVDWSHTGSPHASAHNPHWVSVGTSVMRTVTYEELWVGLIFLSMRPLPLPQKCNTHTHRYTPHIAINAHTSRKRTHAQAQLSHSFSPSPLSSVIFSRGMNIPPTLPQPSEVLSEVE